MATDCLVEEIDGFVTQVVVEFNGGNVTEFFVECF